MIHWCQDETRLVMTIIPAALATLRIWWCAARRKYTNFIHIFKEHIRREA